MPGKRPTCVHLLCYRGMRMYPTNVCCLYSLCTASRLQLYYTLWFHTISILPHENATVILCLYFRWQYCVCSGILYCPFDFK